MAITRPRVSSIQLNNLTELQSHDCGRFAGHYVVQQHKIMEIVMPEQMAGIKVSDSTLSHAGLGNGNQLDTPMFLQLTPYVAYNAPHVKVPPHAAAPQAAQAVDANER